MAKPPCSNSDGSEAYLSVVNLDNGEVFTPCFTCCASFALSMAAAFTSDLSPDESEALGELFDAVAVNDLRDRSEAKAATRAQRRKPPAVLADDPPWDPGPHDPPAGAPPAAQVAAPGPEVDAGMPVALDPPCGECGGVAGTGDAVKLTCDGCGAVIATADDDPSRQR